MAELSRRRDGARRAAKILGATSPMFDDLPDNRLDDMPLLDVVQRVEGLIDTVRPDVILSHHAGDVNIDHRIVHQAVVTACRPQPGSLTRRLVFFEVASSTEWQTSASGAVPFIPNIFVDIANDLETKLDALRAYPEEMRPWPHSRSIPAVEHRCRWLGASVGVQAAEAFVLGRYIW